MRNVSAYFTPHCYVWCVHGHELDEPIDPIAGAHIGTRHRPEPLPPTLRIVQ